MYKKLECFFISVALIIISGITINLGYAIDILLKIKSNFLIETGSLLLSASLGFVVIPIFINRIFSIFTNNLKINIKQSIILSVVITTVFGLILHSNELVSDFIIATGEEFLFRYMILNILQKEFSKKSTYVIGSILFAILLHLNGDFFINLLVKFPSGILFYYLADNFGLQSSIAVHWVYNILVGYFL